MLSRPLIVWLAGLMLEACTSLPRPAVDHATVRRDETGAPRSHDDEREWAVMRGERDGLPAVAMVNRRFDAPAARAGYPWHLSIVIACVDLADGRLPTREEVGVLEAMQAKLEAALGVNAAELGRITWNGTRELLYRVADPERADAALRGIIEAKAYTREFDYRMERDPDWKLAAHLLDE